MHSPQQWKRTKRMSTASSSAAQPAYTTSEIAGSAEQPANLFGHFTSADTLNRIIQCIHAADAEEFASWKTSNPHEKRKSLSNLVGHLQSSIKHALHDSAEQPVQKELRFEVLAGWLIHKCVQKQAIIYRAKKTLCELAEAEHRLFRLKKMVDKANALHERQELPIESQIDKDVLHECLLLCSVEVDKKKATLKAVIQEGSAEQPDYDDS